MRKQSPDNNNPANPLFKVAALEIDKEYAVEKKENYIRVKASLVFKKSSDLRGATKDKDGDSVNVTFGLKVRRASLELVCADDKGQSPNGFVKISKVAYVGGLAARSKLKISQAAASTKKGASKASIRAGLGASMSHLGAKANVSTDSSRQIVSSAEGKMSTNLSFEKVNVTATYAGSRIHWEINPLADERSGSTLSFLEGSVFQSALDGRYVDAAHIKRVDGKAASNVAITASVYISMQDLILEDISFVDNDGAPVALKQIPNQMDMLGRLLSLPDGGKEAKERLLKQVIRKHLVNQGLRAEGNLVEICRAST